MKSYALIVEKVLRPTNDAFFVEHILVHGLCSAQHPSHDPNYIHIGHQQLITDRHNHPIPLADYGHLGEYIPFYFWGHSPMLYMIMITYHMIIT
ncbi:DarT ssDNA thymidine ADP-ribosyltransferase family protein [Parapedobacter pyrenivorans]|uniref:DarT ssDNA thymidine ADP-ribosyltransferase family protein n=1 Tax=Parapedobacter pyrenivorans TaxID=1305674 RepID=UPI003340F87D